MPMWWQHQQQKSSGVLWRWLNSTWKKNTGCWGENRLSKMCLQVIYRRALSPTAMSCSAYFACLMQEFVCGKTGSENSLLKAKPGNGSFPWLTRCKCALILWLHLVALPSEAMTWIEQKGYAWFPLFRENGTVFLAQLSLRTSQKVTYIQYPALRINFEEIQFHI